MGRLASGATDHTLLQATYSREKDRDRARVVCLLASQLASQTDWISAGSTVALSLSPSLFLLISLSQAPSLAPSEN